MKKHLLIILALCATTLAWGTTIVTKTYKIADIASNNAWTDGTAYTSFDLGEEFHIKAVGSTNGVYYTANNGIWRSYQGREKGEFTISAKAGYIITKIKVTYPATKNNGVLSKNPKPNGAASPTSDRMTSGTAYDFNASSVTLYVGNTVAANDSSGQVSISQFEITYEKGIVETFDKLSDETSSSTKDRKGDWFTWKITTGARHKTTDVLYNGTRSLWLAKEGAMETTTAIEGGVKYVSFLWNKFDKNASSITVNVTAGGVTRTLTKEVQTGDDYNQNHPDLVFGDNFGVKSNTKLKIANPQNTTALQIGPITIVPYIFYTQKSATLNVTEANPTTTFTNTQLIDNRDDATAIVYSIVGENDGVATINAETGEVTGLKPGTVTVQAAYGEATTTYQLTITGDGQVDPELTFEKETVWCKLGDTFTNALTHKGDGAVTYTSNRTDRATIDASGKVTTEFYGQVIITASIEASGFYKAAEKTYVVNIQPTETPIYELFSTVTQTSASASATWNGDTGEKWTAVYARRKSPEDKINGHLATRLGATASIVSNARLQGGIKYISFIVRQQNADDVAADDFGVRIRRINSEGTAKTNNRFHFPANENLPVIYVVDTCGSPKPSIYADAYKLYFGNESMKNGKVVTTSGAAPILIDSIAFYPYIYFMKDRTVTMKDQGSYDNMKCNVAEAEYLLNNITVADGGSVSYSIVGENYGASINATTGEVDYSEVTEDADIKIQAKYYKAITSQNLHVNALKAPVITVTGVTSGSMAKTFKDGSFTLNYTLKVGGETHTDIPLTWTSSDSTIASIENNDGNITVNIKMAGSVTITASNEEDFAQNLRASSYSFTLNIAGIGENESLIERFTDITASAWTHSATSFTSTAYGTQWKVNYFTTQYNDKVLGQKAVRLSKDNGGGEINSNGAIEGGIKAVAFDWWLSGSTDQNVQFGVTAGSVAKTIRYDATASGSSNTTHYEQFFGVKTNCNFQFLMNNYTQSSFILGPITITPYIYYKQREVLLDLNNVTSFDSKTVLINNTDEGTISFASANTSVATVNATTGVITAAEGGETDVTATWSEGATTKIHVVAAEVYNRIWDLIAAKPDGTTAPVIVSFLQDIILDIDKTNNTVKILGMDGISETYVYVHADASVPAIWKAEEGSISNKVFGYWAKNDDGSYTLTITSWDKLLYLENGEIPPIPGMQRPTVTTLNNGEDLTIGLDAAPVTLPLSVTYEKVAGTYKPVTNPHCEFSSSDEKVATIDENGQVTVVGVGTAELIAHFPTTNEYEESADTINVTVNYTAPAEGTYWKETFNSLGNKSDYQGYTPDIAGDYGVTWIARNFRHKTSDNSDKVDGEYGVRLSYNATEGKDGYIETNSLEGGVKRLQFKWKTPTNSENPKFTVEFDNKATVDSVDQPQTKEHSGTEYDFGYNANIDKNAKLTIRVTSGTCVSIFGPLTIVPYLFFTQKTAEVDALEQNSYTYPADKLINNTEDGTVTYSMTSNSGATINAATGVVNLTTVTSAATETITATWGEVTTTYSLTISYTAPAEESYWIESFNSLGNKDTYQGYTTGIAGDYGVTWIARNFQHKTSDESDKVDGEYGVRLMYAGKDASKDGYIETNSLEGGVKRLQFKWRTPENSANPKFSVEFDNQATVYTVDQPQTTAEAGTVYNFGYNANIAKNAKFTIRVSKETTCASIFGPLTVVPYLFYTTKTVEKTYNLGGTNTVDASANLINNLEVGETVTYSLSDGAQATINGSTITLANATEDVTVTATWGEVSTTFTLKVTKAVSEVEIDKDGDLNNYDDLSYATVTVKNGATVTYNKGQTLSIKKLILTDGATLDIKAGTIAITDSLILEGGYTNGVNYTTPAIHIASGAALTKTQNTVYLTLAMDTTENGAHYYAFSVPFKVEHAEDITYVDPILAKYGIYGKYRHIKKYNGAERAETGEKTGGNWTEDVAAGDSLLPGVGYIIAAQMIKGYDNRLRVPMVFSNDWTSDGEKGVVGNVTKNQTTVTPYSAERTTDANWNMIASPYMSRYQLTSSELGVNAVWVPSWEMNDYVMITLDEDKKIDFGKPFFIQTGATKDSTIITFAIKNQSKAPAYLLAEEQQTRLNIAISDKEKQVKTVLLIGDKHSAQYELGTDLVMMFGSAYSLSTYTVMNGDRLGFNAVNEQEATNLIPVGYRAPKAGEYTFSLTNAEDIDAYERVDLIDFETGELTNLLMSDYTFTSDKTWSDERFALNVTAKQNPTWLGQGKKGNTQPTMKLLKNGQLVIIRENNEYTTQGQLIKE